MDTRRYHDRKDLVILTCESVRISYEIKVLRAECALRRKGAIWEKAIFLWEYALKELEQNKGAQFDPKLVEAFAKLIREGKIHVNEH